MKKDAKIAVFSLILLSMMLIALICFRYVRQGTKENNTAQLTEEERKENEKLLQQMQQKMEAEGVSAAAAGVSGTAVKEADENIINRSYTVTFRGITFKMPAFTNRLQRSRIGGDETTTTLSLSFFPEVTGANVESVTYTADYDAFYLLTELTEKEAEEAINETGEKTYADVIQKDCILGENLNHGKEKCKYTGLQNKRYWGVSFQGQNAITIPVNDPDHQRKYYRLQLAKQDAVLAAENLQQKFRTMAESAVSFSLTVTFHLKDGGELTKNLQFHPMESTTQDSYILQYTLV